MLDRSPDLPKNTELEILVVEDSKSTRLILNKQLTSWGFNVTICTDGDSALSLLKSQPFDLVITDWVMPNIDGMELIRRIRELKEDSFIYIIVLTGMSKREDLLFAFETGADDFLTKPVDYGELRARIRTASRIANLERQLSQKNRKLLETMERMQKDLQAGAELQISLLPEDALERNGIRFDSGFQPCNELAGDIFNFFAAEANKVLVYLLDVSGHGVKAALLAVTLSKLMNPEGPTSILHSAFSFTGTSTLAEPNEVARLLNEEFQIEKNNSQYFTLIYGIFDTDELVFRYVCAGHPPMLLFKRKGSVEILEGKDVPIGFVADYSFQNDQVQLDQGDRLYIYSDGIPEAGNSSGEEFGTERMISILNDHRELSLKESMQALVHAVNDWSAQSCEDDISLVGIEADEHEEILDFSTYQF